MADHNNDKDLSKELKALFRRHLAAHPDVTPEQLRQHVENALRAIDTNQTLLSKEERDALLECPARKGGETMERLVVLGMVEHGTCEAPDDAVVFVNYNKPPSRSTKSKVTCSNVKTLYLQEKCSFDALAEWLLVPLKISTKGGCGSDIFFLKRVDKHARCVHFVLIECKFGTTTLDGGPKAAASANANLKSKRSENRMMPKILEKLRQTATAIREAIVKALNLVSIDHCTFDLVLACGSPINGPAREVLERDHAYPTELWDHAYLWKQVWEERVKTFLLRHYDNDEHRARYLHASYKEELMAKASASDEDEDEDEDEDDEDSSDDDISTSTEDSGEE